MLQAIPSYPSGPVPPGASLSVVVAKDGNRDAAPDTGYKWSVYHDGKLLNHVGQTAIADAQVLHTQNRRDWGLTLLPDVTGEIVVELSSEHGVSGRWRWEVSPQAQAANPLSLAAEVAKDAAALAAKAGRLSAVVK